MSGFGQRHKLAKNIYEYIYKSTVCNESAGEAQVDVARRTQRNGGCILADTVCISASDYFTK